MRRVIKHQILALTALIIVVVFVSGIVSASGKVGSETARVQLQTAAAASSQPSGKPAAVTKAKTPAPVTTVTSKKPSDQVSTLEAKKGKTVAASTSAAVAAAPAETESSLNCIVESTLKVYKFKDINENGVMDEGEVGIANVRINVDGGAKSDVAGGEGSVSFTVDPGTHTVAVVESTAPAGYYPTTPITKTVEVPSGGQATEYFGNAPYGSISGHKWNDKDRSGDHQEGEPPVEGVIIKLTGKTSLDNKDVSLSTTTGADGSYSFTGLKAGTYTVSEVMPTGMQAVSDESVSVTLAVGQTVTDVDFFNTEKSTTPQPPTKPTTTDKADNADNANDADYAGFDRATDRATDHRIDLKHSDTAVHRYEPSAYFGERVACFRPRPVATWSRHHPPAQAAGLVFQVGGRGTGKEVEITEATITGSGGKASRSC